MTVQETEQPRAQRMCDECHVVDDQGHHQVVVPEEAGMVMYSRHFACCLARGCPDGSCAQMVTRSPGV